MATRSGFFNSVNGDRRYLAGNFAEYFATFIGNGVFPNPSSGLQVVANNNLSVNVSAGKGWINGYYFINDSDAPFTLDVADGVLKRIDRVVFRLDFATRAITLALKKGTFSAAPVAPTLQRDADIYELALADITVNNGVTSISQANITDQRMNNAVCGIVQGLVNQVDTTTIYNQYESWFRQTQVSSDQELDDLRNRQQQEFQNWFESIMDILDGDTAGNLANEITRVDSKLDEHIADYVKHPVVATATFSNNQYTVNIEITPTILAEGMGVVFLARNDSTGAATLRINSRTAYPILRPNGTPVTNIKADGYYSVRYSLVTRAFTLLGEGGDYGNVTASDVKRGVTFGTDEGLSVGTLPVLPDEFLNNTFYRTFPHPNSFLSSYYRSFYTPDNKYLFLVYANQIYRYNVQSGAYTSLGGNGWQYTITNVFSNDEGSKVFVIAGGIIDMYDGTDWTRLTSQGSATVYPAVSNPSGSEIFYSNSSANLRKIDTTSKIVTSLSANASLQTAGGLKWTDDNCVWNMLSGNRAEKINASTGEVVDSIILPYTSTSGVVFNRYTADNIVLVATKLSGTGVSTMLTYKKDRTIEDLLTINGDVDFFISGSDGTSFSYRNAESGFNIYKIGNEVTRVGRIGLDSNLPTALAMSSDGYHFTNADFRSTVVTYS